MNRFEGSISRPKWTESQEIILRKGENVKRLNKKKKRLKSIEQCGKKTALWNCPACPQKIRVPVRCRSPQCPDCARIWAADRVKRLTPVVKNWKYATMANLTISSRVKTNKLRTTFKRIIRLFHEFRKSEEWGGGQGFWHTEAAYCEEDDTWHVHLHNLTDWRWTGFKALAKRWTALTGAKHQPYVRQIKDPEEGVRECLKYITKFADLPPKARKALTRATVGIRTFGVFGGLRLPPKEKVVCLCPNCNTRIKWGLGCRYKIVETKTLDPDLPGPVIQSLEDWLRRLDWPFGLKRAPPADEEDTELVA